MSLVIPVVILEGRSPDRIHRDVFLRLFAGANIEKNRALLSISYFKDEYVFTLCKDKSKILRNNMRYKVLFIIDDLCFYF